MVASAKHPIAALYNHAVLSDVTIQQIASDGKVRSYHAHKVILCTGSRYFYKAFTGTFKEASADIIELYHDDPDHFEFLLKHIYTGQYDSEVSAYENDRDVSTLMGIHGVAKKYDAGTVCNLALQSIEGILRRPESEETANTALAVAVGVYYGYETKSPPELGDLILEIVLNDQLGFTNTDEFDVLIQRYPSFSVDLIMTMKKPGHLDVRVFV